MRRAWLYAIVIFLVTYQSTAAALTVTNELALRFGEIFGSGNGGYVTLDVSTGAAIRTCDLSLGCPTDATDYQGAKFRIEGSPGATYTITLPAAAVLDNQTFAGSSMDVDQFHHYDATTVIDSTTGKSYFYVGARLYVGPYQRSGDYLGSYTVTVEYN